MPRCGYRGCRKPFKPGKPGQRYCRAVCAPLEARERKRGYIGKTLRERLEEMLFDLYAFKLEVVLIPAPDIRHTGHCIRAVQTASPSWYSDFCGGYTCRRSKPRRSRKHDTLIRRQETIRALERLLSGYRDSLYAQRLLDYITRKVNEEMSRKRRERANAGGASRATAADKRLYR